MDAACTRPGRYCVVCRENDRLSFNACQRFNDDETDRCTKVERDFLRKLLGGCSTPISALAEIKDSQVHFKGNILSLDGRKKVEIEKIVDVKSSATWGNLLLKSYWQKEVRKSLRNIRHAAK
jgi:hydroxymethylbilane synthase